MRARGRCMSHRRRGATVLGPLLFVCIAIAGVASGGDDPAEPRSSAGRGGTGAGGHGSTGLGGHGGAGAGGGPGSTGPWIAVDG